MLKQIVRVCLACCTLLVGQQQAQAAIVLTPVTAINSNFAVSVNLFATYNGVEDFPLGSNSNQVGAFEFEVVLPGVATGITAMQTPFNNNLTTWGGIGSPLPSPQITGQTVRFRGANINPVNPSPIPNVTVGTTQNPATLIGTVSFIVPTQGIYTVQTGGLNLTTYEPSLIGFANVSSNAAGGQSQLTSSFQNLSITVVPEPSTFLLCGLAGAAWRLRARRKSAA
ncbi:MAG: PEP-CTERM sorting domain-containing protein [Pirellulaceae bacterium]|nr:PEP-CTERM sorting domain-containing protein [Pirellulaceae bacterium]